MIFNLVFGLLTLLTVTVAVRSGRRVMTLIQTALYVTLVAYPWDHFAITSGAWTYGDPGPLLYRVPLNDMVFIFLGSLFSAVILGQGKPIAIGREAEAEPKDSRNKAPHHKVD